MAKGQSMQDFILGQMETLSPPSPKSVDRYQLLLMSRKPLFFKKKYLLTFLLSSISCSNIALKTGERAVAKGGMGKLGRRGWEGGKKRRRHKCN